MQVEEKSQGLRSQGKKQRVRMLEAAKEGKEEPPGVEGLRASSQRRLYGNSELVATPAWMAMGLAGQGQG